MLQYVKSSLLLVAVSGLMALPGQAATGSGSSQSKNMPAMQAASAGNSTASARQSSNSQQAEQKTISAEGEGWRLQTQKASMAKLTDGSGGGGMGR